MLDGDAEFSCAEHESSEIPEQRGERGDNAGNRQIDAGANGGDRVLNEEEIVEWTL
jgi:hypothetical protein